MIERIARYAGKKSTIDPSTGEEIHTPNGIYLMDAYYEIASYLDLLMEKKLSFVIRARRDRIWLKRVEITGTRTSTE